MSRPLALAAALLVCAPLAAQSPDDGPTALRSAADLFQKATTDPGQLRLAALLFKAAFAERVELSEDQLAAWAVCRVKLARDRFQKTGDPAAAAEVAEALKLAPRHAALQEVGAAVLAECQASGGRRATPEGLSRSGAASDPGSPSGGLHPPLAQSFRVTGPNAEAVAAAAEAARTKLFETWSGPPPAAWATPCEVVVHPTAAAFAAATGQPPEATGRATVSLAEGKILARRIDLRADDPTMLEDALPRELTHVVLADLFPYRAPPAWAEAGMAVLATSAVERDRYRRTLPRCYTKDRELTPLNHLLELTEPPADRPTGFAVQSASLVDFLVRWKGHKAFKSFLGDAQRYGQAAALKRAYGVADVAALEQAWVRSELASARAQAP